MNRRSLLALTILALATLSPIIHAHFLFIKVTPMAEAGRGAEVYFSEFAEAGDPRFIAKVAAGTTLRIQTKPGKIELLPAATATDRLRAVVPSNGAMTVYADCVYGVLSGGVRKGSFLLRHYAKGISGKPDEINAFHALTGTPLEIAPKILEDGKSIELTAFRKGEPLGSATFTTIDADLNNTTIKANEKGTIAWTPPSPGRYSVTLRDDLKTKGEHNGKSYDEIRDFATIAFDWPLVRTDADDEAVSLFTQAIADRAQWPIDFAGFIAKLDGELDGRAFNGKLRFDGMGQLTIDVDDETAHAWLTDQLGSLTMHRRASGPATRKPVLRFADAHESHPLGRLLTFDGGQFASSYRIKDGSITTVNRHVGSMNMTITTLENERNPEGKSLPRGYLVQYWDEKTGALNRAETIRDQWKRVSGIDLPTEHTLTTASGAGFSTKSVHLTDHALLPVTKPD